MKKNKVWVLFQRSTILAVGLLLHGCVSSNASVKPDDASTGAPLITIRWLPPCSEKAGAPSFGVDIFADGNVKYTGGDEARERGERLLRLDKSDYRALLRAARSARDGPAPSEKPHGEVPVYCIEVTEFKNGHARVFKSDAFQRRMQRLIHEFAKIEKKHQLVCPLRESSPRTELFILQYAGICFPSDYPYAIDYYEIERSCIIHDVRIYKNTVHYFVTPTILGERAGISRSLLVDEYHSIKDEGFQLLLRTAKSLHLEQVPISDPYFDASKDIDVRDFHGSDSHDFRKIHDVVQRLTGLQFVALPDGVRCGVGTEDRFGVRLSYAYGPPDRPPPFPWTIVTP